MDASSAAFPTMMLNFSQLPVSPPPDHKIFFNHSSSQVPAAAAAASASASLANPLLFHTFAREMEAATVKKGPSLLEKHRQEQQQLYQKAQQEAKAHQHQQQPPPQQPQQPTSNRQQSQPSNTPTSSTFTAAPSISRSSSETKVASPPPHQQASPLPENPFAHLAEQSSNHADPKYAQMVSRMAAYYQQRCQAILNFQQQRCQTWATSHRQKCQEMMQAAMLVVAWYIRDRIGRRRRRNKRAFRRSLRDKNSAAATRRVPKGEAVRKWVMGIPDAALSPSNGIRDEDSLDKEEREFDVEKEVTPDKDAKLFAVADQMIKSQLAKIDVPLLGALNLDDSEDESDSDDGDMDEGRYYYGPDDYEMDDEEGDEDYEEDELDYDEDSEDYVEDQASKEAMHGTGKGSLKRKHSDSASEVAAEEFVPKRVRCSGVIGAL